MTSHPPLQFCVIGLGKMGSDWIVQLLEAGHHVVGHDCQAAMCESAPERIQSGLQWVARKRHPEMESFVSDALSRLVVTGDEAEFIKALQSSNVLFEVVFEDLDMKCELLERLCPHLPDEAMVWTNTSSLSIHRMALATGRPDRVVGTHGMNPVYRMPGVEVIQSEATAPPVLSRTIEFVEQMGKIPFVANDVPGFWVNKQLIPFTLDAIRALERGEISVEDGDKGLHVCLGHPQGVFKLSDFIGLDTMYRVGVAMYLATQDPRYYPPALLARLFKEGHLGVKSGSGFYEWDGSRCLGPRDFSDHLLKSSDTVLSV